MNKESLFGGFVHVFERPIIYKQWFFISLIILLNIRMLMGCITLYITKTVRSVVKDTLKSKY